MPHAFEHTLKTFKTPAGKARYFSLPELAKEFPKIKRLPVAMSIVLESVLRNCDGKKVTAEHVRLVVFWFVFVVCLVVFLFVVVCVVLLFFFCVFLLVVF